MAETFFNTVSLSSKTKAEIVVKYFDAWAEIVIKGFNPKGISYVDLFSGPGTYDDGTESTCMKVARKVIYSDKLSNYVFMYFNDKNSEYIELLESNLKKHQKFNDLKYAPLFRNKYVNSDLLNSIKNCYHVPALTFIDPWGYKGVTRQMIWDTVKNPGCDCILFFNYNRIQISLNNCKVDSHMKAIFGVEIFNEISELANMLNPEEKETAIVNAFADAIRELGDVLVLPFKFKNENKDSTSHYIMHITKHVKAYMVMKDIMKKASSYSVEGVPTYEFNPAPVEQLNIFTGFSKPLENLRKELLLKYSGKVITKKKLVEEHNLNRPYVKENYSKVLLDLECAGIIDVVPANGMKRRKNSIGDNCIISFRKIGEIDEFC